MFQSLLVLLHRPDRSLLLALCFDPSRSCRLRSSGARIFILFFPILVCFFWFVCFVFENSFACVRLCGYDLRGSSSVVVAISVQVRALCVSCAFLLFCEIGFFLFLFLVNEWPGGKSVSLLVFWCKVRYIDEVCCFCPTCPHLYFCSHELQRMRNSLDGTFWTTSVLKIHGAFISLKVCCLLNYICLPCFFSSLFQMLL